MRHGDPMPPMDLPPVVPMSGHEMAAALAELAETPRAGMRFKIWDADACKYVPLVSRIERTPVWPAEIPMDQAAKHWAELVKARATIAAVRALLDGASTHLMTPLVITIDDALATR